MHAVKVQDRWTPREVNDIVHLALLPNEPWQDVYGAKTIFPLLLERTRVRPLKRIAEYIGYPTTVRTQLCRCCLDGPWFLDRELRMAQMRVIEPEDLTPPYSILFYHACSLSVILWHFVNYHDHF